MKKFRFTYHADYPHNSLEISTIVEARDYDAAVREFHRRCHKETKMKWKLYRIEIWTGLFKKKWKVYEEKKSFLDNLF